jgi:hypothetical protein
MVVEATIFDRDHRVDDLLRDAGERHIAPLLSRRKRSQHRRFEPNVRDGFVLRIDDFRDGRRWPFGEVHADDERDDVAIGRLLRHERHTAGGRARELSRVFDLGPFAVAQISQSLDELRRIQANPSVQVEGASEDPRNRALLA